MAVACGLHHSAAVAENGTLYVWGLGDYGQHGLGDTNERHVPNRIEGLVGSIAMVEAGGSHTGIVTDDGDLLMCGFGICGQLGLGDEANRQTPIPIDRALFFHEKVLMVTCGEAHTATLTLGGSVYTFGAGGSGRLGHGDVQRQMAPTRVKQLKEERIVLLAAGGAHTVALSDEGNVYTWGSGANGQLGHNDREDQFVPRSLKPKIAVWGRNGRGCCALQFGGDAVVFVAAGGAHTVAVTAGGRLYTWGQGAEGQLGHGNTHTRQTPTLVCDCKLFGPVVMAACGALHTLLVTSDGDAWSCGRGADGRLGLGDEADRSRFHCVQKVGQHTCRGNKIVAVSAGGYHSAAVMEDGRLWTWGRGGRGRLGHGDEQKRVEPQLIESLDFARIGRCHKLSERALAFAMGTHDRLGAAPEACCHSLAREPALVLAIANLGCLSCPGPNSHEGVTRLLGGWGRKWWMQEGGTELDPSAVSTADALLAGCGVWIGTKLCGVRSACTDMVMLEEALWEKGVLGVQVVKALLTKLGPARQVLALRCKDDESGRLPLHVAVHKEGGLEVVKLLLQAYPEAASIPDADGDLPLHLAASLPNNLEVVAALLAAYPGAVSVPASDGRLPLHVSAAYQAGVETVAFLLGAYHHAICVADDGGDLPLHLAVANSSSALKRMQKQQEHYTEGPAVVALLLDAYPEAARVLNNDSALPLVVALDSAAAIAIVVMLLEVYPEAAGMEIPDDKVVGALWLPLHLACASECGPEVVALLLEAFPSAASVPDVNRDLPLHLAAANTARCRPADWMSATAGDPEPKIRNPENGLEIVKLLLKVHPEGASAHSAGGLPLHFAERKNAGPDVEAALLAALPPGRLRAIELERLRKKKGRKKKREMAGEGNAGTWQERQLELIQFARDTWACIQEGNKPEIGRWLVVANAARQPGKVGECVVEGMERGHGGAAEVADTMTRHEMTRRLVSSNEEIHRVFAPFPERGRWRHQVSEEKVRRRTEMNEIMLEASQKSEEELEFWRVWGDVIENFNRSACPGREGRGRPWMEGIKESLFNFLRPFEEEEEEEEEEDMYSKLQHTQQGILALESCQLPPAIDSSGNVRLQDSKVDGAVVEGGLDAAAASFVPMCRPLMPKAAIASAGVVIEKGLHDFLREAKTQCAQRLESIKLTSDVLKWYRHADSKISELFLCRLQQLAAGDRSKILSKRLVGSKNFAIFETYLDQGHSAQRILFTETRESIGNGILIWYVSKHKHVSRYMKHIDEADARLDRPLDSALSLFGVSSNTLEGVMLLNDDTVLLDPMANTPLKLHDAEVYMLTTKQNLEGLPMRLTSAEKAIIEKPGTVLVLGRAGTGKTVCIANKMRYDRETGIKNQLFVARSSRICRLVGSLQGSLRKAPSWIGQAVGLLAGDDGSEVLLQTLGQLVNEAASTLGLIEHFPPAKKVDYYRFKKEIVPAIKHRLGGCAMDALVLWTVMQSFIKGSIEAVHGLDHTGSSDPLRVGRPIGLDTFLGLGVNRLRLSQVQRREAFQVFSAARALYDEEGLWDSSDLVLAILRTLHRLHLDQLSLHPHAEPAPVLRMFTKVYVDEVQDVTNSELALLLHMSSSRSLFLAGDPAQSVVEGVDFRFAEVRSVFFHLTDKAPEKPMTLQLNFRSHTGILQAAGVVLEWLFGFFPGSCERLPNDKGLCKGPRPGLAFWTSEKVRELLQKQAQLGTGLVVLTPDHRLPALKRLLSIGDMSSESVFGIREAKGLDFPEVVIIDFFNSLDEAQKKGWKQMLTQQGGMEGGFSQEHPEVETLLKLLYTAMTRAQRRLNFIETAPCRAASAFLSALEKQGCMVELRAEVLSECILSPDEWVARGLDFAWESHGYVAVGATDTPASAGVKNATDECEKGIAWLDRAMQCFEKAGVAGAVYVAKVRLNKMVLGLRSSLLCARGTDTKVWRAVEKDVGKVVGECIAEGMWLEAESLIRLVEEEFRHHRTHRYRSLFNETVVRALERSEEDKGGMAASSVGTNRRTLLEDTWERAGMGGHQFGDPPN